MSNVQLTEEIKEMVKKQLPGLHAETLSEFFKEAEQTKKDFEDNKNSLKVHTVALAQVRDDLGKAQDEIRKLKESLGEIEKRETEVLARENKQTIVEVRASCANEMVALVKEMFNTVFRNTTIRKTVTANRAVPIEGMAPGNGMSGYSGMAVSHPETEEHTETEE